MIGLNEELASRIRDLLDKQLNSDQYDIVDVLPVPNQGDRMVRLRTIEELLQDFDGYLLKIKPKSNTDQSGQSIPAETLSKVVAESLYDPDGKLNAPFLFKNAELLYSTHDYALARNIYNAIIKSGTRTAAALDGIGRCLEAEGKLDEAKSHYEESIAYQPNLEAFQHLAALYVKQKKDENAAELLERALQLRELSSTTRFELLKAVGNCWVRLKRIPEAQKSYEQALAIHPQAGDVRSNLGALHLQTGKISEAKKHFQDALSTNPRNDKALAGIASCHLAEGDKRVAHDYFAKALQIELNNPTAIYHLVKCAFELKSYATAARVLEEYIQIAPVNANLMYSLAGLQFHLGRVDDAAETTKKILQLSHHHPGAKELLSMIEGMNRKKT